MQSLSSVFRHEIKSLSFFPLLCVCKWYTSPHFDVKDSKDLHTPLFCVPPCGNACRCAWGLSLSHFRLSCRSQRGLQTMKLSCLYASTWWSTAHVLSSPCSAQARWGRGVETWWITCVLPIRFLNGCYYKESWTSSPWLISAKGIWILTHRFMALISPRLVDIHVIIFICTEE